MVLLEILIWTLLEKFEIIQTFNCFDVDSVLDCLVVARSFEIRFDVDGELRWFLYDSNDSFAALVPAYEGLTCGGSFLQVGVRISYWTSPETDITKPDFSNSTLHRFQSEGIDFNGIPCIFDRRAFVVASVAEAE